MSYTCEPLWSISKSILAPDKDFGVDSDLFVWAIAFINHRRLFSYQNYAVISTSLVGLPTPGVHFAS